MIQQTLEAMRDSLLKATTVEDLQLTGMQFQVQGKQAAYTVTVEFAPQFWVKGFNGYWGVTLYFPRECNWGPGDIYSACERYDWYDLETVDPKRYISGNGLAMSKRVPNDENAVQSVVEVVKLLVLMADTTIEWDPPSRKATRTSERFA